ncbi:MAG: 1-deoxy-D-xylulose-5-phosphate reductoisomerase [Bacteroidales bacterium]|nr:1-deoxy-D-xylulose-5-phosphate reductoisomerase [Bacteroidales bacterium]
MKKGIAILGSTGSIGTQALGVISATPNIFSIELLSAHSNAKLLLEQINQYKPKFVVITDKKAFKIVSKIILDSNTQVLFGEKNLLQLLEKPEIEIVLNAVVGFAGLKPLIHSIKYKKQILLANKESIVIAGEVVMSLAKKNNSTIIPIDSEHSAIFQCLLGEKNNTIDKVILTASGGPFLDYTQNQLRHISPEDALKHPNWKMGQKVSVDSASLMNKGLELIEARWLFDLKPKQIDVIIHPQSVIHSLVQFTDGNLKAQLSSADMQLPIQYALHYPKRAENSLSQFSLTDNPELTFRQVDRKKFRNLALAFIAMEKGGNMPAILNAANEIAVKAFLNRKWPFYRIPEVVEEMMNSQNFISTPKLETYFETTNKCFADSEAYIRKHI